MLVVKARYELAPTSMLMQMWPSSLPYASKKENFGYIGTCSHGLLPLPAAKLRLVEYNYCAFSVGTRYDGAKKLTTVFYLSWIMEDIIFILVINGHCCYYVWVLCSESGGSLSGFNY